MTTNWTEVSNQSTLMFVIGCINPFCTELIDFTNKPIRCSCACGASYTREGNSDIYLAVYKVNWQLALSEDC